MSHEVLTHEKTLTSRSSAELRQGFMDGAITPLDVLEDTLERIAEVNASINGIAHLNRAEAERQAEASGERWRAGRPLSLIDGLPISIKDSINAVGTPWRHGSRGHVEVPAATADSPPAARLKEGGAVIFAKTTMPDFGMSASGVSSLYGIVRNPWNLSTSPGGSSSGAGATLAAGVGVAGIGTDIAGSVRIPASHCGLFALKPTQGRIAHLAPSTVRSPGPMARSAREGAELYGVIAKPDPRDNSSLPGSHVGVPPLPGDTDIRDLRVGLLLDLGYGEALHPYVAAAVLDAAEVLRDAGAEVTEVPPVFDEDPYAPLDRVFQVRARTEWEGIPEHLRDDVLPAIADWCLEAATLSATQHSRDLHHVQSSAARVYSRLSGFDIIVSPTLPGVGYSAEMVGLDEDRPLAHCSWTCWSNQTGQPAANVAFGSADGHPIGIQIWGRRFDDERVLALAQWLELRRPVEMPWPTFPFPDRPLDTGFYRGSRSPGVSGEATPRTGGIAS